VGQASSESGMEVVLETTADRGRIKARIALPGPRLRPRIRRLKDAHPEVQSSELSATNCPQGYAFEMLTYLVKPREPTVLSHKEYHEISPTNLLLSAIVRPSLPNGTI